MQVNSILFYHLIIEMEELPKSLIAGGNTELKKEKMDGQIDIITKVSPFIGEGPNRKGFNVGDFKVIVDSDNLPFNSMDQVDKFLSDLIKFTGDYSGKAQKKDYYVYHPKVMSFIPVKVIPKKANDSQAGGKRKKQNKKTIKRTGGRNTKREIKINRKRTIKNQKV